MSKSELSHLDVTLFVPLAFFVNAYMSLGVPEYFILLLSMVSTFIKVKINFFCISQGLMKPKTNHREGTGYAGAYHHHF